MSSLENTTFLTFWHNNYDHHVMHSIIMVKPPIKDTLKEDNPPNKGHTYYTHSAQNNKRKTSLQRAKLLGPNIILEVPLYNYSTIIM